MAEPNVTIAAGGFAGAGISSVTIILGAHTVLDNLGVFESRVTTATAGFGYFRSSYIASARI